MSKQDIEKLESSTRSQFEKFIKNCSLNYLQTLKKYWDDVFDYLMRSPLVEDVVVSGGDSFMLNAKQIRYIGENLLRIPHIRRIRLATKGIAIFPPPTSTKIVSKISSTASSSRELSSNRG